MGYKFILVLLVLTSCSRDYSLVNTNSKDENSERVVFESIGLVKTLDETGKHNLIACINTYELISLIMVERSTKDRLEELYSKDSTYCIQDCKKLDDKYIWCKQ